MNLQFPYYIGDIRAMKAIVAGASGLVGQELLTQLVQHAQINQIYSLGRTSPESDLPKVEFKRVDFADLPALPDADVAFCALGTTIKKAGSQERFFEVDHGYVLEFARACLKAGVKTFAYVSAQGANANSAIFYSRVKGRIENDLEGLGFESLVIIRPSLLLGPRKEKRAFESLAQNIGDRLRPFMIGPLRPVRPVKAAEVASALIRKALAPNGPLVVVTNSQI